MAPTKKEGEKGEKEAKLTPEQSAALILDYLRKQNRPYSATDISANLKNRVTKAAAAKLLKDMHERNDIEGRAAGKQIVYHSIQDEADTDAAEKLQDVQAETLRLTEETDALRADEKELRLALREGVSRVSVADLKASISSLDQQKAELAGRLHQLQSAQFAAVSAEELGKVDAEHRKWSKIANSRKKIRMELWQEIADAIEKDKIEETKEALGLEI